MAIDLDGAVVNTINSSLRSVRWNLAVFVPPFSEGGGMSGSGEIGKSPRSQVVRESEALPNDLETLGRPRL